MPQRTLIAIGALMQSATLGPIAIAAATRCPGLVLVDARVRVDARGARCLSGRLRNTDALPITARTIEVLLLDRHGRTLENLRSTTTALAAGGCWDIHAWITASSAVRFRVEHVGHASSSAGVGGRPGACGHAA